MFPRNIRTSSVERKKNKQNKEKNTTRVCF